MKYINRMGLLLIIAVGGIIMTGCESGTKLPEERILVFSKTKGFRHQSIEAGKKALLKLGEEQGYRVDTTEDASYFVEDSLKHYSAVVFLNTTRDVLDHTQQAYFERYIQAGGGFVGIHAAADTEYDWPWYGQLVGAYFDSHPKVQEAVVKVTDDSHPTTQFLPREWRRSDEWYNYKNINPNINILASLDESSYEGGKNGDNHPIVWYHEFDGGRAFYTGGGHTDETFSEPEFIKHLAAGIEYAIGGNRLDYSKAHSKAVPDENRFVQHIYATHLNEPMELEVFNDNKLLFIERKGAIKLYNIETEELKTIATMEVHHEFEDGLLGLTKDPNFDQNGWIYLYYSPKVEEWKQHVSRFDFHFEHDSIDFSSEKVLLEVPVQRETCCHSAGSLEFGPKGNLFISTGDDTNPFDMKELTYNSNGYAPLNELEGYTSWDAQRSSGNTMDLRGSILRITPTDEGGYTIPEGNLFPKDGSVGRPEIYVKGCRNPFRIAIDQRKGWLYWGDVGPDAGKDSTARGPRGYDEVNQAQKAGYFGWPYFVGNNYAYKDYNYKTGESANESFDPAAPVNNSPNNTGAKQLPPAQPAFMWYPYAESPDFPITKQGGRNAMAGPTYYYHDYEGENKLPAYYDGKFIAYDWMRGWMLAVTMNETGELQQVEPFLSTFEFFNPIDIVMGEDGTLFLLEYGTGWFSQNPDARLSRIDYAPGNRAPVPKVIADKTVGAAPLTVQFSGEESYDFDGEAELTYTWEFGDEGNRVEGANPTYTFDVPGVYEVTMTATDPEGDASSTEIEIRVGNDPPEIMIGWEGNKSFYWDDTEVNYSIVVNDKEDGAVTQGVKVSRSYLPFGEDETMIAQGHQQTGAEISGASLIQGSDCKACHQMNRASIGPTYTAIAERYDSDESTIKQIAGKIINGGNGNWGDQAMAAHPQFSQKEAEAIASYILKLDEQATTPLLDLEGTFVADLHDQQDQGVYIFRVSYTDKGGRKIGSISRMEEIRLKPGKLPAVAFDDYYHARKRERDGVEYMSDLKNESWLLYKNIDLEGIKSITLTGGANVDNFKVELRRNPRGPAIAVATLPKVEGWTNMQKVDLPLKMDDSEMSDLYVVCMYEGENSDEASGAISSLHFHRKDNPGKLVVR